jgi:hypothetical protein
MNVAKYLTAMMHLTANPLARSEYKTSLSLHIPNQILLPVIERHAHVLSNQAQASAEHPCNDSDVF